MSHYTCSQCHQRYEECLCKSYKTGHESSHNTVIQSRAEFEKWASRKGTIRAMELNDKKGCAAMGWNAALAALQQSLDTSQDREDALTDAIRKAIDLLGPEAPICSGCEYEWNHALHVLREAIDHARRVEEETK